MTLYLNKIFHYYAEVITLIYLFFYLFISQFIFHHVPMYAYDMLSLGVAGAVRSLCGILGLSDLLISVAAFSFGNKHLYILCYFMI